ncbi:MAG: pyridoxine 5'-phosphate synthase [Kiritimatiellae bacterium]|nr:pyridoxine 5'-phosphate synthase [Kiritimatiellia bacterium]MDW8458442.1 pyridoxine 5'-phosphate synthase [Verrucomicrobiota bacterium]
MIQLGVNIDHVATLRQVRKTPYPDPVEAARLCRDAGAHGITVHLREDRRHIQDNDVERLARERVLPLNLEMANSPDVLAVALKVRPDEACLVPERRQELTTEGGLDARGLKDQLAPTIGALKEAGVKVSLFIAADPAQIEAAAALGAPVIELHTGEYCDAVTAGDQAAAERELERLIKAADFAHKAGLQVNAGHGINLQNVAGILRIPHLHMLNIGHSIVSRAVFVGLHEAVAEMIRAIRAAA